MTRLVQRRLTGFVLAIAAAAALLGWAAHTALGRGEALSTALLREQTENFRIADQFETELHRLRTLLTRFEIHHDITDWRQFQKEQKALDAWLDERRLRVTTRVEREVLVEIDAAYEEYFEGARNLDLELLRGAPWSEVTDFIEQTASRFERLGQLAGKLLKANQGNLEDHLAVARGELRAVRGLLFGALAALLALGALLAVVVWRDMIQPLRMRLVESEDIIARQEKLASLGVLAAGVAHEIRNPLTAIKARLFTQRKHLTQGTPAADDAEVISGEIHRLERIVRDFLAFARPGAPEFSRVDAGELLHAVHTLLKPQLDRDGIHLTVEALPDLTIRADPAQLKQVLINLVQNAADAAGPNGTLKLTARTAVQRLRQATVPVVLLEVGDSGPGIPADIQERLFDPFFTTKENGTGLGLSIALRIVERHGGALEFQTQPGRGTVFGVVLPKPQDDDAPILEPTQAALSDRHAPSR
jgi:signal transduction histidine kinase